MNSRGPSTEPWSTPWVRGAVPEVQLNCCLSVVTSARQQTVCLCNCLFKGNSAMPFKIVNTNFRIKIIGNVDVKFVFECVLLDSNFVFFNMCS